MPSEAKEAVKVTQADIDMARKSWNAVADEFNQWDNLSLEEQASWQLNYALHREEAEKRIVDWLRGQSQSLHMRAVEEAQGDNDRDYMAMLVGHSAAYAGAAGEIERGDHHSGEQ